MTEEFVTSLKAVNNFLGDYPSKITLQSLKSLSESIKLAPEQKKSVMDLAFRERTLSLLSGSDSMVEVRALLRLAASAAVESICSASTPFLLFADLVNTKSIAEAEANFHFLEETIKALKDASLFGSGRNTLLRMCNDLLRRLSKSQNTVFCGRIQLFLTSLFPLNEKSGLNFTSNFNLEKEVAFNQDPDESLFHSLTTETDADGGEGGDAEAGVNPSALVNADLYRRFWRLQEVLKAPAHCYTSEGWKVFVECTECVVSTFQSIRLIAGCGSEAPWHQFTMYLTSEKLIDLQLMDRNFRRYILTQLVIIFQYLTAQVKFKNESQRLNDEQLQWVQTQQEAIVELMRRDAASPSDVTEAVVEHILYRETHWNQWKNQSCPSFIREPEKSVLVPRKRRTNPLQDRSGRKLYRFGNSDLDELWSACPDNLESCRDKRGVFQPPDLQTYFQDAILELDPQEKVEEQYKRINREEWSWRALRLLSRRCSQFYTNWNPPGRPIKDYLTNILTEKLQSEGSESRSNGEIIQKQQQARGHSNRSGKTLSSSAGGTAKSAMGCNQKAPYGAVKGTSPREDLPTADSRARSRSPLIPETSSFSDASTPVIVATANKPNSLLSEDEDEAMQDQEQEEEEMDEDTDGEAADEDDDLESGDSEDSKSRGDRQGGEEAGEH
ncbi:THO complex subunit 1 [Echinococcus granulosus]|uniref:UDP galactose 4 epimerase n=1 Tax=Echinococcus granulosus TaxID=6210 RepID=A0A068WAM3_ECHGR|nr:THO complex subunit 1 [Echinococcus granulosus]CDS17123.1 UDP galactose 4 epimerase [Echinococcus granulosus]